MDKLNIKMDDGTQIDDFQDLKDVLEELRDDISNIKYFLRNPKKYQQWD